MQALFRDGRIEPINDERFGKQFYCLIGLGLYDKVAGLSWDNSIFIAAEESVL